MMKKVYYTEFVEHHLRMAIRYTEVMPKDKQWHKITTDWLLSLPLCDRNFLATIFDRRHIKTIDGIKSIAGTVQNITATERRLRELEENFARTAALI